MARILLLSSRQVLSGDIVKDLLEKGGADLRKIDIVTSSGNLESGDLGSELYVAAFAFAEHQETHSHAFLADVQRSLAPGGVVTIVEKQHTVSFSMFLGCVFQAHTIFLVAPGLCQF